MKNIISVFTAVIIFFIFAIPIFAGFRISPDIMDVSVKEGVNSLPSVNVGNETSNPEDFVVILAGYGQGKDGSTIVLDQDSNPLSAKSFLKFSPESFHLESGQIQKIDITASIPEGTEGGRYAVLLIVTNSTKGGVSTISRLGVPIRLATAGSELIKNGRALFNQTTPVKPGQPIPISITYSNDGNIHYKVKWNAKITNFQGQVIGTISKPSLLVLPGYSRELTVDWIPDGTLEKGIYDVSAEVTLEDGTLIQNVQGTFEISDSYIPPPAPTSIIIKPSKASSLKTGDGRISIDFPQGAVLGDAQLSFKSYPIDQLPAPPVGYAPGSTAFEITGLTGLLVKPAVMKVRYSSADLDQANGDPSRLVLARWDEAGTQWTILKTSLDSATQTLSTETNQFSIWAVLIGPKAAAAATSNTVVAAPTATAPAPAASAPAPAASSPAVATAVEGTNWKVIWAVILLAFIIGVGATFFVFLKSKRLKT
jgi:hypothetical protein